MTNTRTYRDFLDLVARAADAEDRRDDAARIAAEDQAETIIATHGRDWDMDTCDVIWDRLSEFDALDRWEPRLIEMTIFGDEPEDASDVRNRTEREDLYGA